MKYIKGIGLIIVTVLCILLFAFECWFGMLWRKISSPVDAYMAHREARIEAFRKRAEARKVVGYGFSFKLGDFVEIIMGQKCESGYVSCIKPEGYDIVYLQDGHREHQISLSTIDRIILTRKDLP